MAVTRCTSPVVATTTQTITRSTRSATTSSRESTKTMPARAELSFSSKSSGVIVTNFGVGQQPSLNNSTVTEKYKKALRSKSLLETGAGLQDSNSPSGLEIQTRCQRSQMKNGHLE